MFFFFFWLLICFLIFFICLKSTTLIPLQNLLQKGPNFWTCVEYTLSLFLSLWPSGYIIAKNLPKLGQHHCSCNVPCMLGPLNLPENSKISFSSSPSFLVNILKLYTSCNFFRHKDKTRANTALTHGPPNSKYAHCYMQFKHVCSRLFTKWSVTTFTIATAMGFSLQRGPWKKNWSIYKQLDGVSPLITDPPQTSSTNSSG